MFSLRTRAKSTEIKDRSMKKIAKEKLKGADTKAKEDDVAMTEKIVAHQQNTKTYMDTQADSMKTAKDQSKAQTKSGNTSSGNDMVGGKFVFAERSDTIQKCEAENDLDEIGDYVSKLKEKAKVMGGGLEESNTRLENLNTEMDRAHSRTKAANKKADSILNG